MANVGMKLTKNRYKNFGCTTQFGPFFVFENAYIYGKNERINYSKYCPSKAMAFLYSSANLQILFRKNNGTFDYYSINRTSQFLIF